MDEARSLSYSINFSSNASRAETGIRSILSSLGALENRKENIQVNADISNADEGIRKVTGELGEFREEAEKIETTTDHLGKSLHENQGAISKLGDSAEVSSNKLDKLSGVLKGIGTVIGTLSTVAVTGAVALGHQVISTYADYEQLVGGIETLFGQSSKEVQSYAANAYKTAGLSANQYMELTTSFSASLIQSLGGDTQKAAKYADRAITDMSDNANKMGTSIDSLQNAYRGFSMGNYTMLDNLKLGYGGTQEEMKRLLSDAEKLAGHKFNLSSYADITEAIHVIQTQMGITGTTSKEASETISGSISSTKSAIENLIVGLGNADANIGVLTSNVIAGFESVAENIIPVLENVVGAFPNIIETLLPVLDEIMPRLLDITNTLFGELLNTLVQLTPRIIPVVINFIGMIGHTIVNNLPMLFSAGAEIIASVILGLGNALPTVIPNIIEVISNIVDTLIQNLPLLLNAGMQLLSGFADGILAGIPILIEKLPEFISSMVGFFNDNLPTILAQGVQIMTNLINGMLGCIPALAEQIPIIITNIVNFITDNLPTILDAGFKIVIQLGVGLIQAIPSLVAQLPAIITAVLRIFEKLPGMMLEIGGNMVKGLWEGIQNLAGWIWDKVSGWASSLWKNICGFFGIHSPSRKFAWAGEMMVAGLAGAIHEHGNEAVDSVKTMGMKMEQVMPKNISSPKIEYPQARDLSNIYKIETTADKFSSPSFVKATDSTQENSSNFLNSNNGMNSVDRVGHTEKSIVEPSTFSPIINLHIQENTFDERFDKLLQSLRQTVKDLYDEFREEEIDRLSLIMR